VSAAVLRGSDWLSVQVGAEELCSVMRCRA
jgi:hypothetical protein